MLDSINWLLVFQLIVAMGIPLAGGFLGSLQTHDEIVNWYETLNKPNWTPPNWLFPVAWTYLYVTQGIASWLVWNTAGGWSTGVYRYPARARIPLILYVINLALNFTWSPIFFYGHYTAAALADIIVLDAVVTITIAFFWRVHKVAALLLGPLLVWGIYATTINAYVVAHN